MFAYTGPLVLTRTFGEIFFEPPGKYDENAYGTEIY